MAVGMTLTQISLEKGRVGIKPIVDAGDVAIFNYYGQSVDFQVQSASVVQAELDAVVALAGGRPIVFQELGCPAGRSPSRLAASEAAQAAFLAEYTRQMARRPEIRVAFWFQLVDWSPALAASYDKALTGAGFPDLGAKFAETLTTIGLLTYADGARADRRGRSSLRQCERFPVEGIEFAYTDFIPPDPHVSEQAGFMDSREETVRGTITAFVKADQVRGGCLRQTDVMDSRVGDAACRVLPNAGPASPHRFSIRTCKPTGRLVMVNALGSLGPPHLCFRHHLVMAATRTVMSIRTQLITADELLRMPDDGNRRELVSGELREMTPAGHEHGRYTMRFSVPLGQHVDENNLGVVYAAETGFQLSTNPDTVRAPDVAFVARERAASVSAGPGYFRAPDLAVEVVSPSDTYAEVESKVEDWLRAGCRLVVVVNPRNQTLKTYRALTDIAVLTVDDTLDAGDVVPGFRLPVRKVFPSS